MRRGMHQLGLIDFARFETGQRKNVFVMLPTDFRSTVSPDARSPVFDAEPEVLLATFRRIALEAPRTVEYERNKAGTQLVFRQRSRLIGYPDYLTVEAVPAGKGKSALCIFGRSRYGIRDFGVNERRARDWVRRTAEALQTG